MFCLFHVVIIIYSRSCQCRLCFENDSRKVMSSINELLLPQVQKLSIPETKKKLLKLLVDLTQVLTAEGVAEVIDAWLMLAKMAPRRRQRSLASSSSSEEESSDDSSDSSSESQTENSSTTSDNCSSALECSYDVDIENAVHGRQNEETIGYEIEECKCGNDKEDTHNEPVKKKKRVL